GQLGPRFDQVAQELYLVGAGSLDCFLPSALSMVMGRTGWRIKLPNRVMPIGDAAAARKDRAIELFANIIIPIIAVAAIPVRPGIDRMIFVIGLAIEGGLGRF